MGAHGVAPRRTSPCRTPGMQVLFLEGGGWCYGPTPTLALASCAGRGGFKPPNGEPINAGTLLVVAIYSILIDGYVQARIL